MRRSALALILGCLLLVAGASALDGYDYYQTIEYAGCDQSVYQQDIVIHRTTGTAYNETAGGLETWHIYAGDHCREDYGDIRFTNSTEADLAYYLWPDYTSSSARFAVRLEGAEAAGEVTIWYGAPSAATTSDGDATYKLFDQFDAQDAEKWDTTTYVYSGNITISGGTARISRDASTATPAMVSRNQIDTTNATIESRIRLNSMGGQVAGMHIRPTMGVNSYLGYYLTSPTSTHEDAYIANSAGSYVKTTNFLSWTTAQWYTLTWDFNGSTVVWGREGTSTVYTGAYQRNTLLYFGSYSPGSSIASFDMDVDYVLVRAYSATPPAALTFSGEQVSAAPPRTTFIATPSAGLAPLTVQFTDTSAGSPTAWAWTFGDGNTSTAQNPQHTYTTPGTHTVTLNATNEYGSDEEIRTDYITVYAPVTAQFSANITGGTAPLIVQFTDLSTGGPTSWLWTFGDGNTSTAQNPQHTYAVAGAHTVTLTASHPYDSDTETKTAYITIAVLQPFPGLTLIPRDLTGNGLYTDINGNNRLDYNDLTIFFQSLAWAKTAQPTSCFDFNGNGWLDYNDVIALFTTISGEHT